MSGFKKDHTFGAFTAAERKGSPADFKLARWSLVGSSFHVSVMSWLLGQGLYSIGLLQRPPTVAEVGDSVAPTSFLHRLEESNSGEISFTHARKHGDRELARSYMARQSSRGGDIAVFGDVAVAMPIQPRWIDPTESEWRTAIATVWRLLVSISTFTRAGPTSLVCDGDFVYTKMLARDSSTR